MVKRRQTDLEATSNQDSSCNLAYSMYLSETRTRGQGHRDACLGGDVRCGDASCGTQERKMWDAGT